VTDLAPDVMDAFERIFPTPVVIADWDEVLGRAGEKAERRTGPLVSPRVIAVAAALLVGGLLVAPALSVGDRLLDLLQRARTAPEVQSPVWSPDGRKIAFVRRDHTYDLYVMNADGSGLLRLTRDAKVGGAVWSPDG
jgi:hypothetical protein